MKRLVFVVICAAFLAACGPSAEKIALDNTSQELAKTKAELAGRLAVESADAIGRREARASMLRHTSGCNVVPLTLAQDPGYSKYARFMQPAYTKSCRETVLAMAVARQAEAKKIAAKAAADKKHKAELAATAKKKGKQKQKPSATKQG